MTLKPPSLTHRDIPSPPSTFPEPPAGPLAIGSCRLGQLCSPMDQGWSGFGLHSFTIFPSEKCRISPVRDFKLSQKFQVKSSSFRSFPIAAVYSATRTAKDPALRQGLPSEALCLWLPDQTWIRCLPEKSQLKPPKMSVQASGAIAFISIPASAAAKGWEPGPCLEPLEEVDELRLFLGAWNLTVYHQAPGPR